jgi:hypothetical protein
VTRTPRHLSGQGLRVNLSERAQDAANISVNILRERPNTARI